jgi:hypothetical protein
MVCQDVLVSRVSQDLQERMENQALTDLLGHLEVVLKADLRGLLDREDFLDHQDQKARMGRMDNLDHLDLKVLWEGLAYRVCLV